ncbi:MAG: LysE family translocator [Capnocytophaga sp.]|jgi:lysE type amino acid translocator|uniref:LysE family translocator n=1 Tax=Capnocytophaga sp. TaxID=44737 RepID=UPI0028EFC031|nr:LysE family transporter [uncultured Capnocytophaga sp.]
MFADILLAVPLGLLLAFTIGPVFFVLLETAITKGFRAAMAFDIGVVVADALFILFVYFTTNSLLTEIKDDPKLFFTGGLIMMAYGLISFIKLKKDFKKVMDNKENAHLVVPEKVNYTALFIKGFLLNFINIGVLGFWLGIIIVFGPKLDMNANRILVFFTSIILVYFGIDLIKILIAKKLKNRLTAFHIYKIKRAISIILLFFGVFLILQAFFPHLIELTNN